MQTCDIVANQKRLIKYEKENFSVSNVFITFEWMQ